MIIDMALGLQEMNPDPIAAKEGLPYWIFWLLVSVILLLVFYIFLRNRDLRIRLSSFLSGARRRMIRLRLHVKIKKEREKKAGLWKDLGRTSWHEDIRAEGTSEIFRALDALESDLKAAQITWHEAYTRIESLEKAGEDARAADDDARAAEIREWEKKKEAIQDRIIRIKRSSEPLYENMGRILDQARLDHESLAMSYFQIDRAEKTIGDLLARIEKLQ